MTVAAPSSPRAIVGIDVGTTAVKAVVLGTDGVALGSASSTVHIQRDGAGRAEQDMEDVWRAVTSATEAALAEAGTALLLGVCVVGQGDGAWLIDDRGHPVGPAVLWLDGRGADRVGRWISDGRAERVRAITGSAVFPGALPIVLEELEEEHPDRVARASTHLNCKDWIRFRLTGLIATDPTDASRTYLDVRTGTYSTELISALGHERFSRLLPPIQLPTTVAGTVTPEASRATGLPPGLPVVTGMIDTTAGGIGLGVRDPGDVYAILGTTAVVGAVADDPQVAQDTPAITFRLGQDERVLECLAPMNGTPSIDWARRMTGTDRLDWAMLEKLVESEPPGSGGVLFLPYTAPSGERAPFVDTAASASWHNLAVTTTTPQLVRAVYEGVALSLRECMERLKVDPDAVVRLCGGGAQSAAVCQILADVTGRTITRSAFSELGALGAAALTLQALGIAPSTRAAADQLLDPLETFSPSASSSALHDQQFATFLAVRDAHRAHWGALRELRRRASRSATTEQQPEGAAPKNGFRPPDHPATSGSTKEKELA